MVHDYRKVWEEHLIIWLWRCKLCCVRSLWIRSSFHPLLHNAQHKISITNTGIFLCKHLSWDNLWFSDKHNADQIPQSKSGRFIYMRYCLIWRSKTDRFITLYERVDPENVLPSFRLFRVYKSFDNHKLINLLSPKRDWYRKEKGGRANLWIHSFV
jgi:hypothetical protein